MGPSTLRRGTGLLLLHCPYTQFGPPQNGQEFSTVPRNARNFIVIGLQREPQQQIEFHDTGFAENEQAPYFRNDRLGLKTTGSFCRSVNFNSAS